MFLMTNLKNKEKVFLNAPSKIVSSETVGQILEFEAIKQQVIADCEDYTQSVKEECETLKENAKKQGYQEGLDQWNTQLAHLEKLIHQGQEDLKKAVIPLITAAIKKIIGKELAVHPEMIADVIKTASKGVMHHQQIVIYVSKEDLSYAEEARDKLKQGFDHLQSFQIILNDDLKKGEAVIETEAGIIKTGIEAQIESLEKAFTSYLNNEK